MLAIRLLKSNSKILSFLALLLFSQFEVYGNEPVDIWKKEQSKENKIIKKENLEKETRIDYLKKDDKKEEIEIVDSATTSEELVKLSGLYDPGENDLSLTMWSNTDGVVIKDTFKRITKIELSDFSERLLIDTIFTYSYPPEKNLTNDDFLEIKLQWLLANKKINFIEEFLNKNIEFSGKSKLIKYLVDHYIASADITKSCEKVDLINKEIKDNYLDRFRVYCLILNKKKDQAQLNFDLLREEGRSDNFFNSKILFLLGVNEKPDNKISDKNLLYFYLSSITVENFKYEPKPKTDKNIWKYLNASNLITVNQLEDPETINKYEEAANQGTFDKSKIFEIYLSIPFNINQLINAKNTYLSLDGYEARAIIYQKLLLSDNIENKLELLFLLKDLFEKDKLKNIYSEYLSDSLKSFNSEDIPENYKKKVASNIIKEKNKELGKIKYDDKILHRSRVIKLFTEENSNQDKVKKDFQAILKKINRNKKYFFSIKDVIVLETLNSEGFDIPKELNIGKLSKNLTIPSNLGALIEKEEIGMFMLKLIEIIGSDDVQNLDPETLYFIVNLLNKAKIKKVRNKILNLTLPLRV